MLNLGELEKLKQGQHEAGLLAVLNENTWDDDARRCLENKIVEWKLNSSIKQPRGDDSIEMMKRRRKKVKKQKEKSRKGRRKRIMRMRKNKKSMM